MTDIKQVATETIEQAGAKLVVTATDILDATAKAFPEIAGKGFEFYATYIFGMGVADIVVGVVQLALAFFILFHLFPTVDKHHKKAVADHNEETSAAYWVLKFLMAVALLVLSLNSLGNFHTGIIRTIAPEGAVIAEIIANLNKN